MNTQVPYRKRCGGQGDVCSVGSPFKHLKKSDTVSATSPTTSPVPLQGAGDGDLPNDCFTCPEVLYAPDPPPAGANWLSAFLGGELWQGNAQDMLTLQTFTPSGTTDLGVCHKYGFKKYAATRVWDGCFGYLSNDVMSLVPPSTTAPDQIKYLSAATSCSLSWFNSSSSGGPLVVEETAAASCTGGATVNPLSGEITSNLRTTQQNFTIVEGVSTQTVDIDSGAGYGPTGSGDIGLSTVVDYIAAGDWHGENNPGLPMDTGLGSQGESLDDTITSWNTMHPTAPITPPSGTSFSVSATDSSDPNNSYSLAITVGRSNTQYTLQISYEALCSGGPFPQHNESFNFTVAISLGNAHPASEVESDLTQMLSVWKLNGHEPWRTDPWTSIMPLVQRREVQGSVVPIGFFPVNQNDLRHPINDADGNPPFSPDWSATYDLTPWADPSAWVWVFAPGTNQDNAAAIGYRKIMDGAIIGAPQALAGATGWFDFYFKDERFCGDCQCGDECPDFPFTAFRYGLGGTLADCALSLSDANLYNVGTTYDSFLPSNATHWTNNTMAHGIPRGAMIDMGGIFGINGMTMVKAAFTRLPVPSYNFFRPCGADRCLIDEPTAQPINTAGTLQMDHALPDGGAAPNLNAQQVLIAFTGGTPGGTPAGYDGIWTGVTQSPSSGDYVLNLPTVNPGVNYWPLPSDYYTANYHAFGPYFSGQGGLAGIVRFSGLNTSAAALALCGREQITFPSPGEFVTFQSPQTNVRDLDLIDLYDQDMTPRGNVSLIHNFAPGDPNYDLVFRLGSASYDDAIFNATTIWATSHGAPGWYWDDAGQKFDFRYGSWQDNGRAGTWSADTDFLANQIIIDENGNFQTADNAGTSGALEPTWPTTTGARVSDGGVTWTCQLSFGGCHASCIRFNQCDPQVMAFTPNADVDSAWKSGWFGAGGLQSFIADGLVNSRVQANVEFEIPDLLYQTPKCPNVIGGTVYSCHEDLGAYQNDGGSAPEFIWSPPQPKMEARCGVVLGAGGKGAGTNRDEDSPALPMDALGKTLTWPAMAQPQSPGVLGAFYNVVYEPWMRYQAELASCAATMPTCSGCRWADFYYSFTIGRGR